MRTFEDDILSDFELSEMLAAWTVPDPPARLRVKVLTPKRHFFGGQTRATAAAFLFQAAAVALLLLLTWPPTVKMAKPDATAIALLSYQPHLSALQRAHGGGGSGASSLPLKRGEAPPLARRHFIPPNTVTAQPHLPVAPAISAQAPQLSAANYGDPLSAFTGGFGSGHGAALGAGSGDGYGPGSGGGTGGGIYQIGGAVSAPVLVSKVEPEYSEEARRAKYSGVVELSVVIDEHGLPRDIRVIRPLGLGLDEKAIQAVGKWRFRPALKNGRPVSVTATVDVSFRLL